MGQHDLTGSAGRRSSMIFQEPMSALNPVMRVGPQIAEGPQVHLGFSRAKAAERASTYAPGRDPRPGAPVPRLPARVLRRHAAAGDDRDRAVLRPGGHPLRRADHRARRHDPGPDPAAAGPAVPGVGREPGVRHPRPAVVAQICRTWRSCTAGSSWRAATSATCCSTPGTLHARAGQVGADFEYVRESLAADPRVPAEPDHPGRRVPVPPALLVRRGGLQGAPTPLRRCLAAGATACLHYERCRSGGRRSGQS